MWKFYDNEDLAYESTERIILKSPDNYFANYTMNSDIVYFKDFKDFVYSFESLLTSILGDLILYSKNNYKINADLINKDNNLSHSFINEVKLLSEIYN